MAEDFWWCPSLFTPLIVVNSSTILLSLSAMLALGCHAYVYYNHRAFFGWPISCSLLFFSELESLCLHSPLDGHSLASCVFNGVFYWKM